jgi:hypothetical protein
VGCISIKKIPPSGGKTRLDNYVGNMGIKQILLDGRQIGAQADFFVLNTQLRPDVVAVEIDRALGQVHGFRDLLGGLALLNPLSSGTCFKKSFKASSPPAEAPMPTIGNAACLPASCASGGMGAAAAFLPIFAPDGFFMVAVLVTLKGGKMGSAWCKPGNSSPPARRLAARLQWDP